MIEEIRVGQVIQRVPGQAWVGTIPIRVMAKDWTRNNKWVVQEMLGRLKSMTEVEMKTYHLQEPHEITDDERRELEVQLRMANALRRIAKWFGEFPETGEFYDNDKTRPVSFAANYGSNGERDFMRELARKALEGEEG